MVRFFFCTDIHGSEAVWRKFLNTAKYLKVDTLIMGGDITGKRIVPIIQQPDGTWKGSIYGVDDQQVGMRTEEELLDFERRARFAGCYTHRLTPEEDAILSSSDSISEDNKMIKGGALDQLFDKVEAEGLQLWIDMIDDVMNDGEKRVPEGTKIIICPGNDDKFAIDEIIEKDPRVIFGEGAKVDLDDDHEMISYGWTNPTPWHTYRECDDETIGKKIEELISLIDNMNNAVFCFHCPPHDSIIDEAPLLNEDLTYVGYSGGEPIRGPVGCKAVRSAIEKYQPLMGLFGHIHESAGSMKIGRTYCLNPGSEYTEAILKGFLVELKKGKIKRMQRVES
ncbi:MAG: metallophosphoesterase [Candidatus Heimdallarchaeota archaeon]|nr:MAG: metallophosphoesterase [Candidatus Heimdallarchaeota archaeon]